MQMKGLGKLRERLPDYPGKRIFLLPLRGLVATLVGYIFPIALDILPRVLNSIDTLLAVDPFIPLLGSFFDDGHTSL